jgi:hypothetical protein
MVYSEARMNPIAPYNVLYFGCWPGSGGGHYLFASGGRHTPREVQQRLPWRVIDGGLQPGVIRGEAYHSGPENQGQAMLHRTGGWTCVAFWDRSEDSRGGCNSNFFVRGNFTFDEVVQISKEHFPTVWKRFPFKVTCVGVDDNGFTFPDSMTLEEKGADYARILNSLKLVVADRNSLIQEVGDLKADLRILGVPLPGVKKSDG